MSRQPGLSDLWQQLHQVRSNRYSNYQSIGSARLTSSFQILRGYIGVHGLQAGMRRGVQLSRGTNLRRARGMRSNWPVPVPVRGLRIPGGTQGDQAGDQVPRALHLRRFLFFWIEIVSIKSRPDNIVRIPFEQEAFGVAERLCETKYQSTPPPRISKPPAQLANTRRCRTAPQWSQEPAETCTSPFDSHLSVNLAASARLVTS